MYNFQERRQFFPIEVKAADTSSPELFFRRGVIKPEIIVIMVNIAPQSLSLRSIPNNPKSVLTAT
jgi:hypothetical protein